MKDNPGKCHVILSSNTQRDNTSLASSLREKLLGITLELKFEEHINKICKLTEN